MKKMIIIRDTDSNFKNSDIKIRLTNSIKHFENINLNAGIDAFNKLQVACELILFENTEEYEDYFLIAKKDVISEENSLRVLKTTVIDETRLKDVSVKTMVGIEEINLGCINIL